MLLHTTTCSIRLFVINSDQSVLHGRRQPPRRMQRACALARARHAQSSRQRMLLVGRAIDRLLPRRPPERRSPSSGLTRPAIAKAQLCTDSLTRGHIAMGMGGGITTGHKRIPAFSNRIQSPYHGVSSPASTLDDDEIGIREDTRPGTRFMHANAACTRRQTIPGHAPSREAVFIETELGQHAGRSREQHQQTSG